MLDIETRRRIDSARDILVGKVPDPKAQVVVSRDGALNKHQDHAAKAHL